MDGWMYLSAESSKNNSAFRSCLTCTLTCIHSTPHSSLQNGILIKIKRCLEWLGGSGICSSQPVEYTPAVLLITALPKQNKSPINYL